MKIRCFKTFVRDEAYPKARGGIFGRGYEATTEMLHIFTVKLSDRATL